MVRLAGHLPLFKLTSVFVLPEALNFIGAAGAALMFAIFSFAISHRRAQPYLAGRVIRAPLAKTIAIFAAMNTLPATGGVSVQSSAYQKTKRWACSSGKPSFCNAGPATAMQIR